MKKLNNSGITTIEIILCFVLIFVMTFSMYGTVSSYNDKRVIEKDKNEILSYKYLLTKTIQDDFVNNELSHVSIENNFDPSGKKTYILHCTLKNGTKKILKVEQTLGYSTYNPTGLKNQSDSFMISYGTEGDLIEYPLPNLGSSVVESNPANGVLEHTVQELSIQDVRIEVLEHQVLSIQIVFYHPNFGNEYGISIMAPVNYVPDINLPLTSYTLLYDDNGGSGCSDKSIHKMEDDYWGELCTPVRNNYIFLGWNTKSDGTGSTITSESKATKNITVHAKWRKNQVHIKLNANGGSLKVTGNGYSIGTEGEIVYNGSDNIHNINYDSSLTSSGLTNWNNSSYLSLKKDGYGIDSNKVWNTAADGSGTNFDQTTAYSANDFCDASSSDCTITLYANWRVNHIYIKLNANGGSLKVTGNGYTIGTGGKIIYNESDIIHSISYGGALTSSGLTNWNNSSYLSLKRDGYSIDSNKVWNTAANGTGTDFDQTTAYSANNFCDATGGDCTATLYTNWKPNTFTVKYKGNNANHGSMSDTTCTYDSDCSLRANTFTRLGYTFLGWSTSSSATSATYGNQGSIKNAITSGTLNLYAVWQKNKWKVSSPEGGADTFAAALSKANNNATLTLTESYTDNSSPATTQSNVSVDLGGYTLSTTKSTSIKSGHTMNIKNGTLTCTTTTFGVLGTLNITGGTYKTTHNAAHVVAVGSKDESGGHLSMSGGKLTTSTVAGHCTLIVQYSGSAYIKNATVENTKNATGAGAVTVQNDAGKVYFDTGSVITSSHSQAVYIGKGDNIFVYALKGSTITGKTHSFGITKGFLCLSDYTTLKSSTASGRDSVYVASPGKVLGVLEGDCGSNIWK